mgnify:CR=1 FL=1
MKAYVLLKIRVGEVGAVVKQLRRVDGVVEADMTFGPYDAVAVVQAEDINRLGNLVYLNIQPIPGILETLTCLVSGD